MSGQLGKPMGKLGDLARATAALVCPTGKTRYWTDAQAAEALDYFDRKAALHAREADRVWPIRAYACPQCDGWHLTSQPDK